MLYSMYGYVTIYNNRKNDETPGILLSPHVLMYIAQVCSVQSPEFHGLNALHQQPRRTNQFEAQKSSGLEKMMVGHVA